MRKIPKPRKLNPDGISYTSFLVGSVALFAPVLGLVYAADKKSEPKPYSGVSGGVGDVESPIVSREELVSCQQNLDSSIADYKYMRVVAIVASVVAGASLLFNYIQSKESPRARQRYREREIYGL